MGSFTSSTGFWEIVMTVGPLAVGAIGVGVIHRYPRRFAWVLGAYTIIAVVIAVSPFVLASAADAPRAVLEPLLRETKLAITGGAMLIVSVSGLWVRRTHPPPVF
ncbi:MAG: hypothetical protein ACYC3F_03765 [Gemmatimonadaceae bacterium]